MESKRRRRSRSRSRSRNRDSRTGTRTRIRTRTRQSRSPSPEKRDRRRARERRTQRSPPKGSPARDRRIREVEKESPRSHSRDPAWRRDRDKDKERERSPEVRQRSVDQEHGGRERSRGKGEEDRRRQRSASAESSDSSGSDRQGRKHSPVAKHVDKEETKKQKDMLKALETPEEKRARRLAKKEAKERKKREKMGWSEEYMGYTNADNPFGDNNLLGTFKWQKALDKKGIGHLGEKDLKDRNKQIQEDNRRELQKVQSKIRIRDGRAKPIDLLAKYISAEDDDLAVEMHEPYTFLNGLTVTDMEDLLEDIKGKNVDFWRDMTIIAEDEIIKLKKLEASGKGPVDRRDGINTSVTIDVQMVFKGKTYSQLQAMNLNIESKIRAGGSNLDIGYWESLLQQVRVFMARARERHQDVLRQKLFKLKQEQGVESEPLFPIIKEEPEEEEAAAAGRRRRGEPEAEGSTAAKAGPSSSSPSSPSAGPSADAAAEKPDGEEEKAGEEEEAGTSGEGKKKQDEEKKEGEEGEDKEEAVLTEEDLIQQSQAEYDSGRYSPTLLTTSELPLDTHTITPEEDAQRLGLARRQFQVTGDVSESAEDAFVRRAKQGMGTDEAQFSVELPLTGKMYLWADKYRPRKPRFFNRVHTGFEWNKYNQTHYDFDNPPPKIVQGYKFNIFYPDLINKRSTPQYFLEPSPDNKDFGILRFHAGPPYEDIAFKIVNREWEYSHRHGFRCQFANGIFQLWFHFKRYRYRR
ncbi:hypothetical protein CRUP_011143 [Coryphaenoides rupestris]|nr:hypothetical protein CRUP_011143 [Coryphaenoides rupestris]